MSGASIILVLMGCICPVTFDQIYRALLGMPQPPDAAVASDTALEQQFSQNKSKQMQPPKGSLNEDDSNILGPAFSSFGRKLMLIVAVIALIILISVLIFEEMERSNRQKLHQLPISTHTSIDLPSNDETVVTKENWKDLQRKADRARQHRLRTLNPRARAIQERAAREAAEREHKATLQLEKNAGLSRTDSDTPASGGWAQKAGMRPHSGASQPGAYGQYW
jgi:hypothetical protein